MGKLASAIAARNQVNCKMGQIIAAAPKDIADDLRDVLPNTTITNPLISEELGKLGLVVSEDVIRKHRAGKCACGRAR